MGHVLEYQKVTKEYQRWSGRNRLTALQEFSLTVEKGEIFGFLGPNGAGKTTAIHLAMGFVRPSSGSGRMLGKPFGDVATRRLVGFLPENIALYHRSAVSVLRFYGGLNGMSGAALRRGAAEILRLVHLEAEADRNVKQFSRGMLQRIGLAQALMHDPTLLVLDEPASALDPAMRVAVRELLLRCRAEGKTIFLSSHLLSEIELVCDRVAIIHHGRVLRTGRLDDLRQSTDESEIVARSVPKEFFPEAVRDGTLVHLRVGHSDQREVIERVWSLGGEVVSVTPVRQSLEDLFLALTRAEASGKEDT
jgi:ABC-2 type transport system ATP-binding protein